MGHREIELAAASWQERDLGDQRTEDRVWISDFGIQSAELLADS
jgi:hypothetical protein